MIKSVMKVGLMTLTQFKRRTITKDAQERKQTQVKLAFHEEIRFVWFHNPFYLLGVLTAIFSKYRLTLKRIIS